MCTWIVLSSTTAPGHTVFMRWSLVTSLPADLASNSTISRGRLPMATGTPPTRSSRSARSTTHPSDSNTHGSDWPIRTSFFRDGAHAIGNAGLWSSHFAAAAPSQPRFRTLHCREGRSKRNADRAFRLIRDTIGLASGGARSASPAHGDRPRRDARADPGPISAFSALHRGLCTFHPANSQHNTRSRRRSS